MRDAAWDRVKRLFDEALHAPERERVLAGADPDVRREVEELLRAHDRAPEEAVREGPGATIGRYRLLQQIGEGGFGVVYMAEQTEPVSRKVALKVLKPGMDTGQVVARFEAERQALALMDHPNIARVLDAGTADSGRPYFVMELVRGVPVTQYCDEARLDTAARLDLFVAVCNAVQHAHQKGIIHRDLKPSNVMVTLHDGVPVPKVIDFGIAKALDRKLTERTLFTEFRQMIGTPEYMAPEQAELSGLDIDTRADIYSLGVLLYELLTGTKPFDLTTLMERGYEEILRTIREVDPPRPSTRVSTMGEERTAVAQKRHTEAGALQRLLRGDLDWIVMKALEKDRTRRYETANGLAMDIRRHLADEPVLATPPSAAYRLRKYARRHRVGVAAAAAVAVALVAGATVAAFGWAEASEQRRHAEERAAAARREAVRARAVLELVDEMVGSADPDQVKGRHYTVRQLLDDFDRGLGGRLAGEPEVEATIRATMGRAYASLGVMDKAASHLDAALGLLRRTSGEDTEAFAQSLLDRGRLARRGGDYRGAERSLRQAAATRARILGADHASTGESLGELAQTLAELNRLAEAAELAERAVEIHRAALPPGDLRTADALGQLAGVRMRQGAFDDAERLVREVIEIVRLGGGERQPRALSAVNLLSTVLSEKGDLPGAEREGRAAHELAVSIYGDAHPATLAARGNLATTRAHQGDFAGAERDLRETLEACRRLLGDDHDLTATLVDNLGMVRARCGDLVEGERLAREALDLRRRLFGPSHPQVAQSLQNVGATLHAKGDLAGAEACCRDALAIRRAVLGPDHPVVGQDTQNLAVLLSERGDEEGALAAADEAEALYRRVFGDDHPSLGAVLNTKSQAHWARHDFAAAEKCAREALGILRAALGEGHPEVSMALTNVAWMDWAKGDLAAARGGLEAALTNDSRTFGEGHPAVAMRRTNLAWLLRDLGDLDEAERLLGASLAAQFLTIGPAHGDVARTLHGQANVARDRREFVKAEGLSRRALAVEVAAHGEATQIAATIRGGIAQSLEDAGKLDEAETFAREALAIRSGEELLGVLGACELRRKDWAAAEKTLRECLRVRTAEIPGLWPRWEAASLLGEALAQQGRTAEALPLLAEAAEKMKPPAPYADRKRAAEERLARFRDR